MEWLNKIYALISVCMYISLTLDIRGAYVYLVNIPEPVQYHIYALGFPFDLRCESVTYVTGPGKTGHVCPTTEIQFKATLKYCLGTPSMCV